MSEVPDLLLQVWKLVLLGFMYLFFLRVLRAVWANLRASTERPRAAEAVPVQVQRQHDAAVRDSKGINNLKVLEPANAKGTVFAIGSNELTMGRGSGCAILLADDTFVSTLHARVFRRDNQVFLEDLGSTNGTLHNGKKVSSAIALKKGDRISVGRTVLEAPTMTTLRWGSATDVGMVREVNQDAFLIDEPLFAVADGMGGHQGGEVASATALEVLKASFTEHSKEQLLESVRRANAKVWDKGQLDDSLHGMGTTLTLVAKLLDDTRDQEVLALVNVGDSRGYLFRDGELTQVTTDHSLVEEMMAAGEITAEEAETHPRRNILTRALGVEPTVEADLEQLVPVPGDRILLCSDGLIREISDNQVAAVLRRLKNPDEAARELVNMAKTAGGHDNITVVIVDVEPDETPASAPATASRSSAAARKPKDAKKSRTNGGRITVRMLAFFVAVLGLIAIAVGSVWWYARASFFVSAEGEVITIYRGRPEPVLWFEPTVAETTNVTLSQILPGERLRIESGASQASLDAAHNYIRNLVEQAAAAQGITAGSQETAPSVVFIDPQTTTTTVASFTDSTVATTEAQANPVATTSAP